MSRLYTHLPLLLLALAAPARAADVTVTLPASDGFVIKDNAGALERLRVDEATGNISRNGALFVHTTGTDNTFVGEGAGNTATTGIGRNSAFGKNALSSITTGRYNSGFGRATLSSNTTGGRNSAFGENALSSNTSGRYNSASGFRALRLNTTGFSNSAFGAFAVSSNTAGIKNDGFGVSALRLNTTGGFNSAFGFSALQNSTTGDYNAAFGHSALVSNTTGNSNLALGAFAGENLTTGSNNIYIKNVGVAAESGRIKIGNSAHTETFIEGIDGNTATGGVAVLINSSNELHTLVSSLRFKESVRDMGEASGVVMALRPVTFRYREEVVGENTSRDYGLIAEEVADVAPDLVTRDADGKPYSVRYHILPSLLLNEMQKQQRTIEDQQQRAEKQERAIGALVARVKQLEHGRASDQTGTDR